MIMGNDLFDVRMKIYRSNFAYIISYYFDSKIMELQSGIARENGSVLFYKSIFKKPYDSITITPQNIQNKLTTLLLFS
jgi:hypothetical protein